VQRPLALVVVGGILLAPALILIILPVLIDLSTLAVDEAAAGSDTITVKATDSLGSSATPASIAVTTNGLPAITAPASLVLGQGQTAPVAKVKLAESGNTTGETFTVTVSDTSGLLGATGTGVSGAGTTTLTITGSLSQVNKDLATLTDSSATAGTDTITLTGSDSLGDTGTPTTIAVTTNGLPAIAAPSTATVTDGKATAITGVSLSESGTTTGETFTVKLSDANGLLSTTGSGVSGSGTTTLTVTGTLTAVDNALAKLKDTDSVVETDTINITATDSLGNTATPAGITVTVTGAPGARAPASTPAPASFVSWMATVGGAAHFATAQQAGVTPPLHPLLAVGGGHLAQA
jgi:hypothetical protein